MKGEFLLFLVKDRRRQIHNDKLLNPQGCKLNKAFVLLGQYFNKFGVSGDYLLAHFHSLKNFFINCYNIYFNFNFNPFLVKIKTYVITVVLL